MTKYLKIFVISLCLVALLTVSCFATSAQTNVTYGHYISPGEYVFNEVLTDFPTERYFVSANFVSDGITFTAFDVYGDSFFVFYVNDSYTQTYRDGSWLDNDFRFINLLDGFYIYNADFYLWWQSNVTRVSPGYESNLLDGFLSAFTMIGQWISSAANTLTSMFWSSGSLTFLGSLCIAALAMAVSFLLIGLISRFLRFRG